MSAPANLATGRRFGRLAIVTAVAGLAVVLGACAKHSGNGSLTGAGPNGQPGVGVPGAGSSATGLPATPIATTTATGGGSGSGGGGTPPPGPATHAYPSDYFGAILTAWNNHDTAYLTLLTNTATKNQLYGFGNINKHWTLVNDEGAMGSSYGSFYNNSGDWIVLRTVNDATSQHQWHAGSMQTWDVMTFPSDANTYVKHFVDAWINGNKARMGLLANTTLASQFLAMSNKPDFSYTVGPNPGGNTAGHQHIEVKEPSLSIDFDLAVVNQFLGQHHAIDACDIGC